MLCLIATAPKADAFARVETLDDAAGRYVLDSFRVVAALLARKQAQAAVLASQTTSPGRGAGAFFRPAGADRHRFPAGDRRARFFAGAAIAPARFHGILRASGPLFSDQFPQALACGFDEVEIPDANRRAPAGRAMAGGGEPHDARLSARLDSAQTKIFSTSVARAARRRQKMCDVLRRRSPTNSTPPSPAPILPSACACCARRSRGASSSPRVSASRIRRSPTRFAAEGSISKWRRSTPAVCFPETYDLWAQTEEKYGLRIKAFYPAGQGRCRSLSRIRASMAFITALEMRKACCDVRKVEPLARALEGAKSGSPACAPTSRRIAQACALSSSTRSAA